MPLDPTSFRAICGRFVAVYLNFMSRHEQGLCGLTHFGYVRVAPLFFPGVSRVNRTARSSWCGVKARPNLPRGTQRSSQHMQRQRQRRSIQPWQSLQISRLSSGHKTDMQQILEQKFHSIESTLSTRLQEMEHVIQAANDDIAALCHLPLENTTNIENQNFKRIEWHTANTEDKSMQKEKQNVHNRDQLNTITDCYSLNDSNKFWGITRKLLRKTHHTANITITQWQDHSDSLFNMTRKDNDTAIDSQETRAEDFCETTNKSISDEETAEAIRHLKRNKQVDETEFRGKCYNTLILYHFWNYISVLPLTRDICQNFGCLTRDICQNFGQSPLLSQYTRKGMQTRGVITEGFLSLA